MPATSNLGPIPSPRGHEQSRTQGGGVHHNSHVNSTEAPRDRDPDTEPPTNGS